MNIELILSRLERVRSTGRDSWQACCPAHHDTSPSLGIGIGRTGGVIVKCRSNGCSFDDICAAIGLSKWDFAPPNLRDDRRQTMDTLSLVHGLGSRVQRRERLKNPELEDFAIEVVESKLARGERLTDDEKAFYKDAIAKGGKSFSTLEREAAA